MVKVFDLNPYQKSLWIENEINSNSNSLNLYFSLEFFGKINTEKLNNSIKNGINFVESARIFFIEKNNKIFQKIYSPKEINDLFPKYGLKILNFSSRKETIKKYIDFTKKRINLKKFPIYKFILFKYEEEKSIFLIKFHHIITDGLTCSFALKIINYFYNNTFFSNIFFNSLNLIGKIPSIELYFQFKKKFYVKKKKEEDKKYWIKEFENINFNFEFPNLKEKKIEEKEKEEKNKENINNIDPNRIYIELDEKIVKKIKELIKNEKTTLFIILSSFFSILLNLYFKEEEINFSYTNNVRPKELKYLTNYFVNMLVLKININSNLNFFDILNLISKKRNEHRKHCQYPFFKIFSILKKKNFNLKKSNICFGQSFLNFDIFNFNNLKCFEVKEKEIDIQFDFSLFYDDYKINKNILNFVFEFNNNLFNYNFIKNLSIIFKKLIKNILKNPNKKIKEISFLTKNEEKKLNEFNKTEKKFLIKNKTIIDIFEENILKNSNSFSIIFENKKLKYFELNEKINKFSNFLIKNLNLKIIFKNENINKEENNIEEENNKFISIFFEKSNEMIISIFSILKCGYCYIPIDINIPNERIEFILEDTKSKYLISNSKFKKKFNEIIKKNKKLKNLKIIYYNEEIKEIEKESNKNLNIKINLNDLCYIIYTSGTTGNPKGVMIEHKNLINYIFNINEILHLNSNEKFLQFSNYCFDVSVEEIFSSLLFGSELHIPNEKTIKNIDELYNCINKNKISILSLTPSVLKLFPHKKLNYLKKLLIGAESFNIEEIKYWINNIEECFNVYGPTEATVSSSIKLINKTYNNNNIGKTLYNYTSYILDTNLNQVPIGIKGELYIGGKGVGRGYLNNEKLTNEKFLKNPFNFENKKNNKIIYKTGDICRFLENGEIEFFGRIDNQIKLRGLRIELEEIENIIKKNKNIFDSIILLREDELNEKYLACYLILKDKTENIENKKKDIIKEIKEENLKKLPNYMLPKIFTFLTEFPLNSSGKINKKLFPKPNFNVDLIMINEYIEPKTEIEKKLIIIWKEILKIEKIGIKNNFFELGGDSIQVILLKSKCRKEGFDFIEYQFFEDPTIEKLSKILKVIETEKKIEEENLNENFQLTPIQTNFFEENYFNINHYNQSIILTFEKDVNVNLKNFEIVLKKLIIDHEIFRIFFKFNLEKKIWVQEYKDIKEIKNNYFEYFEIDENDKNKKIEEIFIKYNKSLNIEKEILFKFILIKLENNFKLIIIIHHLIIDGVSWRILIEDLMIYFNYFNNLKKNEENLLSLNLIPKTNSFKKWSEFLIKISNSDLILNEIKYWENFLNNKKIKKIKIDFNLEKEINSNILTKELDEISTNNLLKNINNSFNTKINDILISCLCLTIFEFTNEKKIYIWLESFGREENLIKNENLDFSRTIGWFTSLFPIILNIPKNFNFSNLIKKIKEKLKKIPNKGIGYGILRYLTTNENKKNLNFKNEPEICFNYLGNIKEEKDIKFDNNFSSNFLIDEKNKNKNLFDINCFILKNKFNISIKFSKNFFEEKKINNLLNNYILNLKKIINFCLNENNFGYTCSDFNLINLKQEKIDLIFGKEKHVEDIFPLSPIQEGILFKSNIEIENDYYLNHMIFKFKGKVFKKKFKKSWEIFFKKNSIFRIGFKFKDLEYSLQFIKKKLELPWKEFNFRNLNKIEKKKEIKKIIEENKKNKFNFENPPLLRLIWIKKSKNKNILIYSTHHLIIDGWSNSIILKKIFKKYLKLIKIENKNKKEKKKNKNKIKKEKKKINFKDYIKILNEKKNEKEGELFWKNYLKDIKNPIKIIDIYKKINNSIEKFFFNFEIEENLSNEIKLFCKKNKITLNSFFQLIYSLFLFIIFNFEEEIIFGVTFSGRNIELEGIENLIGITINHLPFKININQNLKISEILKIIQNNMKEINNFNYFPLNKIQSILNLCGKGLFDCSYTFENYPIEENLLNNFENLRIKIKTSEISEYPLHFIVFPKLKKFKIQISYQKNLFEKNNLINFSEKIKSLIFIVLNKYENKISNISFLTENEEKKLNEFNNTFKKNLNKNKLIQELFEEQVLKTPNNFSIIFENKKLTYNELNKKTNKFGNYLRNKFSIKSNDLISIFFEKSNEMIILILSILKSGGAYIPIDINFPNERINFILKDTKSKILITNSKFKNKFENNNENNEFKIIYYDLILNEIKKESNKNLKIINKINDLCYIIYTSGTTGNPKGVMIEHKNLINLIFNYFEIYKLNLNEKFLQFSNYCFDVSVSEIFSSLLFGLELYIPNEELRKNIDELINFINKNKISILSLTPSVLKLFPKKKLNFLKKIIIGGESCDFETMNFWVNNVEEFYNSYGPTETTVCSNNCLWNSNKSLNNIGKTLFNYKSYILDTNLNQVPIGIKGELYIGEKGVGRGYLNNEKLTNEKFIENPFNFENKKNNKIIYKTGDICRFLDNGEIEFFGRIDNQIKLRGLRIEIDEIENIIKKNKNVLDSVILLREDEINEKYLACYVILKNKKTEIKEILKKEILKILPLYMLPKTFTFLKNFPLNSSGKINKKLFPEPNLNTDLFLINEYIEPKNEIEKKLILIWKEILHIEKIGINNNFFDLGGNSLLIMKLLDKINIEFNIKINFNDFYNNQNIEDLSKIIENKNLKIENNLFNFENIIFFNNEKINLKENKKPILFLIHDITGNSTTFYEKLSKYLNKFLICSIINPNLIENEKNKKNFNSIKEISNNYLNLIEKINKNNNFFYLGGYSIGGIISIEISKILEKKKKIL